MKFFHKGLYKEGLRQCTLAAIIFTSVLLLFSVFTPLAALNPPHTATVIGIEFSPVLFLTFTGYIPIMALCAFSFLHKRSRSDFYHSIPHHRETLFGSYIAAILTWVLGGIAVCSGTTYLILLSGAAPINHLSVLIYIFNVSVSCIMILGAALLAMSITGTIFSNIVTSTLIIFLPRTILSLFVAAVNSMTVIRTGEAIPLISKSGYNIPFGFVSAILNDGFDFITDFSCGIYTAVLGLIYIVLAMLLFKSRKSETAGSSASSPTVQAIIRTALSFFFCALACLLLLDASSNIRSVIILFSVAIIVYFSYELVTAKKLGRIIKSLPGLLVLAALSLTFIGGVYLVKSSLLSTDWDKNSVSYISIQPSFYQTPSYESLKASEVEITNQDAIALAISALSKSQAQINEDPQKFRLLRLNDWYGQDIKIVTKSGRTYIREIVFTSNEYDLWESLMIESGLYEDAWSSLPENPSSIQINFPGNYTAAQIQEIYTSLSDEVKNINTSQWMSLSSERADYAMDKKDLSVSVSSTDQIAFSNIFGLTVSGTHGFTKYTSYYNITPLTPKTFALIVRLVNENNKSEMEAFWDEFKKNSIEGGDYISAIFAVTSTDGDYRSFNFSIYDKDNSQAEDFEALIDIINSSLNNPVSIESSGALCIITFTKAVYDTNGEDFYSGKEFSYIVPLDDF